MLMQILDFVLHIDKHLVSFAAQHGAWLYALLFLVVFCETGLVVTPFLLVCVLLAAAVLGDAANFEIGKHFGARLFANPDSRFFKQEYLDKTHAFYEKYGGKTIVLARFVPIVRTFAPFVAGMGKMHYGRFLRFNFAGALAWVLGLSYLGYAFGNIPLVKNNFGILVVGIIAVSCVPVALEIWRARRGGYSRLK